MTEESRDLIRAAEALSARLDAIREGADISTAGLAKEVRRDRRIVRLLVACVASVLVMAPFVGIALHGMYENTDRLDTSVTVNRQKALCPLYEMLLATNTTMARERAESKEDYDRAYKVISDGYAALQCKEFKGDAPTLGAEQ